MPAAATSVPAAPLTPEQQGANLSRLVRGFTSSDTRMQTQANVGSPSQATDKPARPAAALTADRKLLLGGGIALAALGLLVLILGSRR